MRKISPVDIDKFSVARPARAFSLVEILVVISVMTILAVITLDILGRMRTFHRQSDTQTTLGNAQAMVQIYKTDLGENPNHLAGVSSPFDWSELRRKNAPGASGEGRIDGDLAGEDYAAIERFVWAMESHPATLELLNQYRDRLVDKDGDGFLEMVDGWGRPLVYAAYVKHDVQGVFSDQLTADDFLPARDTAFLVSAGEDGKWGDMGASSTDPHAEDNVYSYNLEKVGQ